MAQQSNIEWSVCRSSVRSGGSVARFSEEGSGMTKPVRIQRQRTKGWRMPSNTMSVTRPGRWGNPYYPGCGLGFGGFDDNMRPVHWRLETAADMVRHFREYLRLMRRDEPKRFEEYITPLRGANLACWCKGAPCHADVLLEFANEEAIAA